jgi:hypothetical protein
MAHPDALAGQVIVKTFWLSSTALGITVNVFEPLRTTPRSFNCSLYWSGV